MSDPAAARERTIALVEHHADRLALLRRGLQQAGFAVLAHADATSLAAADLAPPPGLFLLDLSNSGEPGLALIGELRRRAAAPIIVITGKVSAATRASRCRSCCSGAMLIANARPEINPSWQWLSACRGHSSTSQSLLIAGKVERSR